MYKRLESFRAVGCNQIRTPYGIKLCMEPFLPTTKGGKEERLYKKR